MIHPSVIVSPLGAAVVVFGVTASEIGQGVLAILVAGGVSLVHRRVGETKEAVARIEVNVDGRMTLAVAQIAGLTAALEKAGIEVPTVPIATAISPPAEGSS